MHSFKKNALPEKIYAICEWLCKIDNQFCETENFPASFWGQRGVEAENGALQMPHNS